MTTVTVDTTVDVDLGDFDTETLADELRIRGLDPDDNDPIARIWQAVTYQGVALEDVVGDLMRERAYRWPPQRAVRANGRVVGYRDHQ